MPVEICQYKYGRMMYLPNDIYIGRMLRDYGEYSEGEVSLFRQIVRPGEYGRGFQPLALATEERDVVAVYMPAGGAALLRLPPGGRYHAQWFDPRSGELSSAALARYKGYYRVQAPGGADEHGHPWDWVLLLRVVPL